MFVRPVVAVLLAAVLLLAAASPASAADPLFDRAFGMSAGTNPDVCTTATGCVRGFSDFSDGLTNPVSVAVSGSEIYAVGAYAVQVYSNDGTFLRSFGSGGNGVAVTSTEVYVSSSFGNKITVYTKAGVQAREFGVGVLAVPRGLAIDGANVYVADSNNRRVVQFTTDGTFVRAFNTQGANAQTSFLPSSVAVADGLVYVTDQGAHRVIVFNTGGGFVRSLGGGVSQTTGANVCNAGETCRAGTQGAGAGQFNAPVGVSVAGGEVFVAEPVNNRVSVLGAADSAFRRTLAAAKPQQLAATGTEIYIPDYDNHRINVTQNDGSFLRAIGKRVKPGTPFTCTAFTACSAGSAGDEAGELWQPRGVAFAAGELFVADYKNSRVSVFSEAGGFLRTFGSLTNPSGLAVSDDDVYVTEETLGRVSVFSTAGASKGTIGSSGSGAGQLTGAQGVAVSDGEVYVAESANRRISVFSTAGVFKRAFGKNVNADAGGPSDVCTTACKTGTATSAGPAGELRNPYGVSIAGDEVFAVELNNNRVSVFTKAGTFKRAFGKGVNSSGSGSPDVCTTACKAGTATGTSGGEIFNPRSIAVRGAVYVTERNRVSVFTRGGTFVRAFGKGVNTGAGSADVCTTACKDGTTGADGGSLTTPWGLTASGNELAVAESGNHRISVFSLPQKELFASPGAVAFGSREISAGGATLPVTISNIGTESVALSALEIDPSDFRILEEAGDCTSGAELPAGDSCTVHVEFDPVARGARTAALSVESEASTLQVALSGTGIATELTANPESLDFGSRDTDGGATAAKPTTITNTGTEPITFTGVTLGGADAAQFKRVAPGAGDCTDTQALAVNASCTVRVEFDPSTGGNKTATLEVASNAAPVSVVLSGTGTDLQLSTSKTAISFGSKDIDDGATAAEVTTITNTGSRSVTLTNVSASGDFSRVTPAGDDCTSTQTLAVEATCTVRVVFDPSAVGSRTGTLTVSSDAPAVTVSLSGTGIQTLLTSSETTLAFGARDIDDGATTPRSTTITNAGTETVTLTGIDVTGDFSRVTPAAGDCGSTQTLAANASCTVRVVFDPATVGSKSGTLSVTSNAATVGSSLTGSGIQTLLTSSVATLAFGTQDIDDGATTSRSTTITNTGTETVTLTGIDVTGDFSRPTPAAGDCSTTQTLTANASCTVRVVFDPASVGAKTGTLSVTSNAATVGSSLTGSGIQTLLTSSAATLAFGEQDIDDGATASTATTITNAGTETVTLTGIDVTGDFSRVTPAEGDCTSTHTLATNESCTVRVEFDPSTVGAKSGTLSVASNAATVGSSLTGSGIQTALSSSDSTLAFGAKDIDDGATDAKSTTITNTGTETVTLTGIDATGDFSRVPAEGDDCATTETLAATETCTVRVVFDPATVGSKSGTLAVTSNAPTVGSSLTGSGIQTLLTSSEGTLAFGSKDIDDGATDAKSTTITNTGTETVKLTGIDVTGDFSRVPAEGDDCATTEKLAATETCTVRVVFDPSAVGSKTGTLSVTSNAATVGSSLTGSGIQTLLTSSETTLAFGSKDIDDGATDAKSTTITNTGTETVKLTGIDVSGDFGRVTPADGDCTTTQTLAADASCTVRVAFDPTAVGSRTGTLAVASNAATVGSSLTGAGIQTLLSSSEPTLAFGAHDIDDASTASKATTITNTGTETVTLTGIDVTGDFSRVTPAVGDCATTQTLAADASCTVRVAFDPATVGSKTGTLSVTSNAATVGSSLTGSGIQTLLTSSDAALAFGAKDIDDGATAPKATTITNTGTESVKLTGIDVTGDFGRAAPADGDCTTTQTLAADASCTVRVVFDPASTGSKAGTLSVTSSAATVGSDLTGSGIQTLLSSSQATLAFGSKDIDDGATGPKPTTITNAGTETVTLTGIDVTGDFSRVTPDAGDCTTTQTLAASESCTVRVEFDPAAVGSKTGTLSVTSNAATVGSSLTGSGIQTLLTSSKTSMDFDAQDIDDGATASQSATITNTGTETVKLTGVDVTGDFARVSPADGDCTTTQTLAADESCTVRVAFDPATVGAKSGTLSVTSNAATVGAALTGTGIQTLLSSSKSELEFDAKDIDEGATAPLTTTITNTGTETVTLTGMDVTGDFSRVAPADGDCTSTQTLAATESCTVRVDFDPATVGTKTGALSVKSNAGTVTVSLAGRGIQTLLTGAPGSLALGTRDVDDGATAPKAATITNSGTEPVKLTGVSAGGDGFARVAPAAGDCADGTTLAAGATCAVRVVFDPSSIGEKTGTIKVTSNAADVSLALTGTGAHVDTDRDGRRDSVDDDDDGDGTPDTDDAFRLDANESLDTDRDGIGNNADTDDDGDGTADAQDAFPLDPSRSAVERRAATPPVRADLTTPGQLTRERAPAVSTGRRSIIETGFSASCPAGGPACVGRFTLKVRRRSARTGRMQSVFFTPKVKRITIAPGKKLTLTFRLDRRGRALVRRLGTFTAILRGSVRAGGGPATVVQARVRITSARRTVKTAVPSGGTSTG